MTLDELQAEFPHGSRWLAGPSRTPFIVCGWSPVRLPGVPASHGSHPRIEGWDTDIAGYSYRNSWEPSELRPLPVPCPITEPTTFCDFGPPDPDDNTGARWHQEDAPVTGAPFVTLHPAEPGATEGRYTWNDDA